MDYEMTAPKAYTVRKPISHHIKVVDGNRVTRREARRTFKRTLKIHRTAIKRARRDIKSHRLLIEQARTLYKVKRLAA